MGKSFHFHDVGKLNKSEVGVFADLLKQRSFLQKYMTIQSNKGFLH